jgi:hypothetical protein
MPSTTAPPLLDLLHVALTSHLPDETGRHGGTRLNSSTRHNGPDAINHLRKASTDRTCPEAAPSASKEAPQWPQGLRWLPRCSSQTPDRWALGWHIPQNNSLELGRKPLSSGTNEGLCPRLGALLAPRSMVVEGRPQKAVSRGLGSVIVALRRAWCPR